MMPLRIHTLGLILLTLTSFSTINKAGGLPPDSIDTRRTMHQMVLVEGGSYSRTAYGQRTPVQVKVKGFYSGKYEVTQNLWKSVMGTNPSFFSTCGECPVDKVSWNEAIEFCNRLSAKEGLASAYKISIQTVNGMRIWDVSLDSLANGYRLPTSYEWEFAAKGGIRPSGAFMFLSEAAWFSENAQETTHPAGKKYPNTIGLYDIYGNVSEWCFDADAQNNRRMLKGGCWYSVTEVCNPMQTIYCDASYKIFGHGLRLVRNAP